MAPRTPRTRDLRDLPPRVQAEIAAALVAAIRWNGSLVNAQTAWNGKPCRDCAGHNRHLTLQSQRWLRLYRTLVPDEPDPQPDVAPVRASELFRRYRKDTPPEGSS